MNAGDQVKLSDGRSGTVKALATGRVFVEFSDGSARVFTLYKSGRWGSRGRYEAKTLWIV